MFKFGYTKAKFANMMLFFAFFFGIPMLVNNIISQENSVFNLKILDLIKNQPNEVIGFAVVALSMIILSVSYMLSNKLYKKREF